MSFYALNRGYAVLEKMTVRHYTSALAGPDPPRLAGRTGLGELGRGWPGCGWRARPESLGPARQLNLTSHQFTVVNFLG